MNQFQTMDSGVPKVLGQQLNGNSSQNGPGPNDPKVTEDRPRSDASQNIIKIQRRENNYFLAKNMISDEVSSDDSSSDADLSSDSDSAHERDLTVSIPSSTPSQGGSGSQGHYASFHSNLHGVTSEGINTDHTNASLNSKGQFQSKPVPHHNDDAYGTSNVPSTVTSQSGVMDNHSGTLYNKVQSEYKPKNLDPDSSDGLKLPSAANSQGNISKTDNLQPSLSSHNAVSDQSITEESYSDDSSFNERLDGTDTGATTTNLNIPKYEVVQHKSHINNCVLSESITNCSYSDTVLANEELTLKFSSLNKQPKNTEKNDALPHSCSFSNPTQGKPRCDNHSHTEDSSADDELTVSFLVENKLKSDSEPNDQASSTHGSETHGVSNLVDQHPERSPSDANTKTKSNPQNESINDFQETTQVPISDGHLVIGTKVQDNECTSQKTKKDIRLTNTKLPPAFPDWKTVYARRAANLSSYMESMYARLLAQTPSSVSKNNKPVSKDTSSANNSVNEDSVSTDSSVEDDKHRISEESKNVVSHSLKSKGHHNPNSFGNLLTDHVKVRFKSPRKRVLRRNDFDSDNNLSEAHPSCSSIPDCEAGPSIKTSSAVYSDENDACEDGSEESCISDEESNDNLKMNSVNNKPLGRKMWNRETVPTTTKRNSSGSSSNKRGCLAECSSIVKSLINHSSPRKRKKLEKDAENSDDRSHDGFTNLKNNPSVHSSRKKKLNPSALSSNANTGNALEFPDDPHGDSSEECDFHVLVPGAPNESDICRKCGKMFPKKKDTDVNMDSLRDDDDGDSCFPVADPQDKICDPHVTVAIGVSGLAVCIECGQYVVKEEPVVCDWCHEIVTEKGGIKVHMKKHSNDQFKCSECGRTFTRFSRLKMHRRIHTGERPFKCDICGKAYGNPEHLRNHVRVHTGEKPYVCQICMKAFARSDHLSRHVKRHSGEKNHKCDVCEKRFGTQYQLHIHIRTHTGEKPYKCITCEKRFSRSHHLKRHVKTHYRVKGSKALSFDEFESKQDDFKANFDKMSYDVPKMSYDPPKMNYDVPEMSYDPPKMSSDPPKLSYDTPNMNNDAPKMSNEPLGMSYDAQNMNNDAPKISYDPLKMSYDAPKMS